MKKFAWLLASIVCLFGSPAQAAKDVKWVGVEAGFAGVAGSEGSFGGFGGGAAIGWSFSDALSLVGNVGLTSNRVTEAGGRSLVLSQSVGVQYALDVIQVVPYFGLHAAAYELTGGGLAKTSVRVGAQLSLGANYIVSRDWTFGLEIRLHLLPADIVASPDNPTPFYVTTFAKAQWTWGWF